MDPIKAGMNIMCRKTEPQEFLPGVFIGSHSSSSKLELLKEKNITHILSVGAETVYPEKFTCLALEYLDDLPSTNLIPLFPKCCEFIDEAREKKEGVLIHCCHGVSRSGAVAIAYVIHSKKISFEDAFCLVKDVRPIVEPNHGFQRQLKDWSYRVLSPKNVQIIPKRNKKKKVDDVDEEKQKPSK